MGRPVIDLTGQRRGRLRILHEHRAWREKSRNSLWDCLCSCGRRVVLASHILRWQKSCGCGPVGAPPKHGMYGTSTYRSWSCMKARCLNPSHHKYGDYGGRGIKVCKRWMEFSNFYADMGKRRKGTTLDRLDSVGNYEPTNCRWATALQQRRNQRRQCK